MIFISAPAINAFLPEPVNIIARILSSSMQFLKMSFNSFKIIGFIAFRASSLFMVNNAILSFTIFLITISFLYFQKVLLNKTITVNISNLPSNIQKDKTHLPESGNNA